MFALLALTRRQLMSSGPKLTNGPRKATVPVGFSPEGPLRASRVNSTKSRPNPVAAVPLTESCVGT